MKLVTDSVDREGFFDPRYTCDYDNSSPELHWSDAPEGTQGFAVVVHDPDALRQGSFTHWVIYNIPAQIKHLPAGIPAQEVLPNGIRQGLNDFSKLGYAGPCPPQGDSPHHYVFTVFALAELPLFNFRPTRDQLMEKLGPFILGQAQMIGLYERAAHKKAG